MATKITRISLQLRLIRVLLIIVLIVTLLLTGYLLVVGIDTIGDDLDAFREVHRSHLNHTVEDDHHNHRYDSHGDNKLPANDFGHTLTDGHGHDHREKDRETEVDFEHFYGVTNSFDERDHAMRLMSWVVTMMVMVAFTVAGLIGACRYNGCLVFSFTSAAIAISLVELFWPRQNPDIGGHHEGNESSWWIVDIDNWTVIGVLLVGIVCSALFTIILRYWAVVKPSRNEIP